MKTYLFIAVLTILTYKPTIYSQTTEQIKDSLFVIANESSNSDSLKIDAYFQLFNKHCYTVEDSCDYLGNAISIAEKSSINLLLQAYQRAGEIHKENGHSQIAISYFNQGLRAIKDTTDHDFYSNMYDKLAQCYYDLENPELLVYFLNASMEEAILADIGNYGLGWKYNSYGELLFRLEEYSEAISFWENGANSFQAHMDYDRDGSYYGMNNSYINIAMTYSQLQLWDLSSIYMTKCVAIQDSINDIYSKSWTRYVLASFYEKMGDYDKSIASLTESLMNTNKFLDENVKGEKGELYDEIHRIKFTVLTTLASNYGHLEEFTNADYMMDLVKESYMDSNIVSSEFYRFYETEVTLNFLRGDTTSAIETCREMINNPEIINKYFYAFRYAMFLLKEKKYNDVITVLSPYIGNNNEIDYSLQNAYMILSETYAGVGQYKNAYEFEQNFNTIRDSIRSGERSVEMIKTAIKFDFSNQILEDSLMLANEKVLHSENLKSERDKTKAQEKLNFILTISMALVVLLGLWAVRNAFLNKKANRLIQKQKELVEEQKVLVDGKNKEIIDSINYAKRIQNALLKSDEIVSSIMSDHFILYKPKDIVSGDFYWTMEKEGYLYIAVADCTGHGVPGGFMSMLGISFLNEINAPNKILYPAEILNKLREKIIKELNQSEEGDTSKDGMDISLIRIKKSLEKVNDEIEIIWAGANSSLYLSNNETIQETKGNRQPIGIHAQMTDFTDHKISGITGDNIYLFSDGYPDQFGGPAQKKFKYSQFKKLIATVSSKSAADQNSILNDKFIDWKGNMEQTDDVCVFGIKL